MVLLLLFVLVEILHAVIFIIEHITYEWRRGEESRTLILVMRWIEVWHWLRAMCVCVCVCVAF